MDGYTHPKEWFAHIAALFAAAAEGRKVERRHYDTSNNKGWGAWGECDMRLCMPSINASNYEYRIAPPPPRTMWELSQKTRRGDPRYVGYTYPTREAAEKSLDSVGVSVRHEWHITKLVEARDESEQG